MKYLMLSLASKEAYPVHDVDVGPGGKIVTFWYWSSDSWISFSSAGNNPLIIKFRRNGKEYWRVIYES
jgi:hypothetical protein